MISLRQQQLNNGPPETPHGISIGMNDHAGLSRLCAGRNKLRTTLHLNRADTAGAARAHIFMPAQYRYENSVVAGDFIHRHARLE